MNPIRTPYRLLTELIVAKKGLLVEFGEKVAHAFNVGIVATDGGNF
jgi:hypothetical protein